MKINPLAGKPAPESILVDIPRLITAYFSNKPDVKIASQKVSFGFFITYCSTSLQ